jgi:uncharacterized protein
MWWLFEVIIFGYLIFGGAFLIDVGTSWDKFRGRSVVLAFASVVMIGWVTIFYGSFIEPRTLVVREQVIDLIEDTETSFTVAVVADLHVGPYKGEAWVQKVVDRTMQLHADIIVIPGDFIFSKAIEADMLEPLGELSAPLGVVAVTGNHDYTDNSQQYVVETLVRLGITVLENESIEISVDDQDIVLAGISDLWFAGQPQETMQGLTEEQLVILLSHNPDAVLYSSVNLADLVIAGHTHGGQIRLPWIGSIARLPTKLGNDYDKGLFDYEDQQLFISAGVSETGPRARLFNPPEINLLTINF